MTEPLARRHALVVLALAALAGCSQTPPPLLYTLVPLPGTPVARPVPPFALRAVVVPKYLDRPQIVRHRTSIELATNEFERWAEGLDDMVTRVLLEDLSTRLPATQITVYGSAVTPRADTTVAIDIARFDPDPDGTAMLEARWTINLGEKASIVRLERISVHSASIKAADLVAAMSDCLAQLSDRIAQALAG
ncbi:MAG TPA: PqiC family protein [Stellaceae bacterium]|nr:PqiC family protein [Stellaceae bacterium]